MQFGTHWHTVDHSGRHFARCMSLASPSGGVRSIRRWSGVRFAGVHERNPDESIPPLISCVVQWLVVPGIGLAVTKPR
jgi:hypothetical protein